MLPTSSNVLPSHVTTTSDVATPSSSNISTLSYSFTKKLILVHGFHGALAMALFFPMGSLAIRFLPSTYAFKAHVYVQSFACCVMLVCLGTGLKLALNWHILTRTHPLIGMFVCGILAVQPVTGYLHHRIFVKRSISSVYTHFHVYFGRAVIGLGMFNGILGFRLARHAFAVSPAYTLYTLVSATFYAAIIGHAVYLLRHRLNDTYTFTVDCFTRITHSLTRPSGYQAIVNTADPENP